MLTGSTPRHSTRLRLPATEILPLCTKTPRANSQLWTTSRQCRGRVPWRWIRRRIASTQSRRNLAPLRLRWLGSDDVRQLCLAASLFSFSNAEALVGKSTGPSHCGGPFLTLILARKGREFVDCPGAC